MSTSKPETLDERTRAIVFNSKDSLQNTLFDLHVRNRGSVREFIQTPITDLTQINDRLDTIGQLVEDNELYKNIEVMSHALGAD